MVQSIFSGRYCISGSFRVYFITFTLLRLIGSFVTCILLALASFASVSRFLRSLVECALDRESYSVSARHLMSNLLQLKKNSSRLSLEVQLSRYERVDQVATRDLHLA